MRIPRPPKTSEVIGGIGNTKTQGFGNTIHCILKLY